MAWTKKSAAAEVNDEEVVDRAATRVAWEDASTEMTRRASVVHIYGDTDTGKSTLAVSAAGPIAYIHGLEKVDGVIQKARAEKDIRVVRFNPSPRAISIDRRSELAEVECKLMESAISDAYDWARTIILDTHTAGWEVVQLARLGTLTREGLSREDSRRGQLIYSEINARWKAIFAEFRERAETDNRTSLIVIGRTTAEYKKVPGADRREATGKTVWAGQKETVANCDVSIRTHRKDADFSAVIEKPWMNNDVRGMEIDGDSGLLNVPTILGLITGTDAEEWGG